MAIYQNDKDIEGQGFLEDTYLLWCEKEGPPIHVDFCVDLFEVETKPWPRFGCNAAFVHLKGRGDFMSVFLLELLPGQHTEPQQHLFEEVIYVLSGTGSTSIETADGRSHSFEWGPKSVFALPLNCKYQHFNGSGLESAKLSSSTSAPLVMNTFHNEEFVFNNPFRFPEREGKENHFSGEGDFVAKRPGKHMWETNFVPDVSKFELREWPERGEGSSNIMFILAEGTMHAHCSEMPVGTYKKAHRHGPDFHVYWVNGEGYSLCWWEGDEEMMYYPWKHGVVFAPADLMFHQHFNASNEPARYFPVAFGSLRYPLTESKRRLFAGGDVSVKSGGDQIEYGDQDPRVHQMFLDALKKNGVESKMGNMIDEAPFLAAE